MLKLISCGRKTVYYTSLVILILGVVLLVSTIFAIILHFRDFSSLDAQDKLTISRAFGGILLIFAGLILMNIRPAGLADAEPVLNPEKAAKALEPLIKTTAEIAKDIHNEPVIKPDKVHYNSRSAVKQKKTRTNPRSYKRMDRTTTRSTHYEPALKLDTVSSKKIARIKCPNCGRLNDVDLIFCRTCGKTL